MIRILVADDHPVVRRGIRQILSDSSTSYVIEETDNAQEVILKVMKKDYDIVILDISMPKGGGLDALSQIKRIKPKTNVLMLSIHDDEQYIIRSLKSGAYGYLTKTSAADELDSAVKKVLSGGKYLSLAVAEKIASIIGNDLEKSKHENLTSREFQVFCLLAMGKTTGAIAEELFLSPKTVSTYKVRIMKKMDMKNNLEIIKYALKYKLIE